MFGYHAAARSYYTQPEHFYCDDCEARVPVDQYNDADGLHLCDRCKANYDERMLLNQEEDEPMDGESDSDQGTRP